MLLENNYILRSLSFWQECGIWESGFCFAVYSGAYFVFGNPRVTTTIPGSRDVVCSIFYEWGENIQRCIGTRW